MYDAACMQDPLSNSYCYINAIAKAKPADSYLYQLPFGINLSKTVTGLTCSPCSKSLLNLYASALGNDSVADNLTGLKDAYEPSVQIVNAACGSDFAKSGLVNGAVSARLSCSFGGIIAAALGIWTLIF